MVSNGFSDRLAGGQQWIFGPASKIFAKNLKTRENKARKVVSNGFSAQQTMSTLKCHGNFRPESYFINLRLLNSNGNYVELLGGIFTSFFIGGLFTPDLYKGGNFHGKLRSKSLFTKFEMFGM